MTPEFDNMWKKMGLNDENLKELQEELISNPQKGKVIEETGGLRKLRFSINKGKSGGARVLYVDFVVLKELYLITAYQKNKKLI